MKVLELIDDLEDLIDSSRASMFTAGKVSVSKSEIEEIIAGLRSSIPEEVMQAKWIKDERSKILNDAQHEAEKLILNAKSEIEKQLEESRRLSNQMVNEHEITRYAIEYSNKIIADADNIAKSIKDGAKVYVDNLMDKISASMIGYNNAVMENKAQLDEFIKAANAKQSLEAEKIKTLITENGYNNVSKASNNRNYDDENM